MKTRCTNCRKKIDFGKTRCDECNSKNLKQKKDGLKDKQAESLIKSSRWRKVRLDILRRDKCCVLCAKDGYFEYRNLEVHHIIKRTDDLGLTFDPSNLVTVCKPCHEKLEKLPPVKQKELLDYNPEEIEFYL